MSDKFQNKYRIPSARLQGYDYGQNGAYFITICTQNRIHFFGKIINGIMQLNELGKIAYNFWAEIPDHFPFVELGAFVIMPNHMHGILIINKSDVDISPESSVSPISVQTLHRNVSAHDTDDTDTPPPTKNAQMAKISPKPGTISTIIRSYKSAVTKFARQIHTDFGWQPRFHDHIIRNETAYKRIDNYIINNPINWKEDKFHQ